MNPKSKQQLREQVRQQVVLNKHLLYYADEATDKIMQAFESFHNEGVEQSYRSGYAAGNAKKNYHKKSESAGAQAFEGLEIRVSALEIRLAQHLQSTESDKS